MNVFLEETNLVSFSNLLDPSEKVRSDAHYFKYKIVMVLFDIIFTFKPSFIRAHSEQVQFTRETVQYSLPVLDIFKFGYYD